MRKNTSTPEMRNSLEGLSSRIEMTEEKTVKEMLKEMYQREVWFFRSEKPQK